VWLFQNDLVFTGRVNLPAGKDEIMEKQTKAPLRSLRGPRKIGL